MKYYYTDARIAELMEEWHGIWNNHDIKVYSFPPEENTKGRSLLSGETKWYVNPDCYERLKPQEGDFVQSIDGVFEWKIEHASLPKEFIPYHFIGKKDDVWSGTFKIIQRDGKAFFMPEVQG